MGKNIAALLFSCVSLIAAAQPTVQVIPAAPRYQEPVYLRITPPVFAPGNIFGASVSMNGTSIVVAYREFPEIGGNYPYDVELGRFPTGTYSVRVQSEIGGTPATTQFVVSAPDRSVAFPGTVPAVNYSGMWYKPAESGWGLGINQGATHEIFAEWFAYDSSGKPVWYTFGPGSWTRTDLFSTYSGPISKYTGPYFGGPFDPKAVAAVQVGAGTLSFRDANNGTFSYAVEGVTDSKSITRLPIE